MLIEVDQLELRIHNLESENNISGRVMLEMDDSSSIESFLALPLFDINFGENICVENIKLDMDNEKSQEACASFLKVIEKLQILYNLKPVCRGYRYVLLILQLTI